MTDYNFNWKKITPHYIIEVDTEQAYGCFEHLIWGDNRGGGLWFEKADDKLILIDYDGVSALPKEIFEALRADDIFTVEDSFK